MSSFSRSSRAGPGLAKAVARSFVRRRNVDFVAVEDGPVQLLIETADIVSEGLPRPEASGLVYYGTTSVLLTVKSRGGSVPDEDVENLSTLLANDPHLRLRVLRIAVREARSRAHGELGRVSAEMDVRSSSAGVVVTVDVVAVVHAQASGQTSR
ncbi:MAG TPA: hypothetical protein PK156_14200 [Polyangium sp.]|nr:hypothetical protein [Polyangium sp.]